MPALALPGLALNLFDSKQRGIWVPPRYFFIGVLAAVLCTSDRLLLDPDTHWHVAVGRWIWQTQSVPWVDVFSHTFAGAPWIAKEWLSQVVFWAAYSLAGWWGVAVFSAVFLAASFTLFLSWMQQRLHPTAALAFTLAAIVLSSGHWLARPHMLTFPILMVWTMSLVEAVDRRSTPSWWLLPLMTLWANLHGGFPIGFALAGILAAEAVASGPSGRRLASAAHWGLFGAGMLVAACLTPYGYHAMLVVVTLFASGESLPYITEWQPLVFDAAGATVLGAVVLLILALGRRPVENVFRILLIVVFGYMMLKHVRFASLLGIVAPIVAAGPLSRGFAVLAPSASPATVNGLSAPVFGVLLLLVGAIALVKSPQPSPLTTPAAALSEARAIGLDGPVYNHYDFGGFLIEKGVRTFIDGRTDQLFLGGFMDATYKAVRGRDPQGFAALIERYGVTWALVTPDSDDVRQFDALPGWRRIYGDSIAVVYAKT